LVGVPITSNSHQILTNLRDRSDPVGYKVSSISFSAGAPVAAADSVTAATDIFMNQDNSRCPENCFRPVGLAIDSENRLFVSSDSTGELYLLARTSTSTSTSTSGPASASPTRPNAGQRLVVTGLKSWGAVLAAVLLS
jgi:hypothetical protein